MQSELGPLLIYPRSAAGSVRQSLAAKIPFPKLTDALLRKAAGDVERRSDIAILVRVGGRDRLIVDQIYVGILSPSALH
jgi:hypothetical protein